MIRQTLSLYAFKIDESAIANNDTYVDIMGYISINNKNYEFQLRACCHKNVNSIVFILFKFVLDGVTVYLYDSLNKTVGTGDLQDIFANAGHYNKFTVDLSNLVLDFIDEYEVQRHEDFMYQLSQVTFD